MVARIKRWIDVLQSHPNSWWYGPVLALLALADLFVIVIPTDGLLVSAVMLKPRRWLLYAMMTATGSAIGAWLLAAVLEIHGLPLLLQIAPDVQNGTIWNWTHELMGKWGDWTVFLVALSPIMQHPAIALAAFAEMPLGKVFLFAWAGRVIKYLVMAWIATHAPGFLSKLWGVQDELKEVGVTKATPKEKS